MHKAAQVTDNIMTCFAIGLGLPENHFKQVTNQLCDMTCSNWDGGDLSAANKLSAYPAIPFCTVRNAQGLFSDLLSPCAATALAQKEACAFDVLFA